MLYLINRFHNYKSYYYTLNEFILAIVNILHKNLNKFNLR